MLRIIISIVVVGVVVLSGLNVLAKRSDSMLQVADTVIIPYFNALQSGDVKKIKGYISKELYEKKKTLLDSNSTYSDFLRKYYKDAEISIKTIKQYGDVIKATVKIYFKNGTTEEMVIQLKQDQSKKWKISE